MSLKIPKSNFITDRPVAVLMTFSAAMIFGLFSFKRLPVSLMPELTYPTITVRTEYPGAAPEEVENDISRPIEEALGVIGGLKRISSISRAGVSDVVLEFFWGTDMSEGSQDVLEKLDLVFLPTEAERPLILHFDPSLDPIMELSFSGDGDRFEGEKGLRRLRRIAELQIKRALEPIPGVAAVRIRGGLEEEIHVLLSGEALKQTGLSIQTVIDRLAQENINVAGGSIKEGRSEYMVRTLNEYENLTEIEDTVVVRRDGRNIRIRDLGSVIRSHKELEIVTNTDGRESVQIDIYKEADVNMVDLAQRVTTRIGKFNEEEKKEKDASKKEGKDSEGKGKKDKELSLAKQIYQQEGAILEVVADRSTFIESSINEVKSTAVIGGMLAVLILFLFLQNFKTTVIVAVSIPMSLLITFAPLNVLNVSLNIMSLGGLALGIGMLVDSSIVVLESIFRCKEEGDGVKTAAVRGTFEVRGAVFASTLTSIAVFFPMVFVKGIAGQAFGDLGLAVVFSLLASYVVAVYFIPMLASRTKLQMAEGDSKYNWLRFNSLQNLKAIASLQTWQKAILIPIVYLVLVFLVATVLEIFQKILLLVFMALAYIILKILAPIFFIIGKAITFLPLKLTQAVLSGANKFYPIMIQWSLRNPIAIILVIVLCGWATWEVGRNLETELLPEVYQGEFTFEVRLPVGTPLEETRALLSQVEEAILQDKEEIRSVLVTFGYDVTNTTRSDEGEHTARFKVLLGEEEYKNKASQILGAITGATEARADVEKRITDRLRHHFENIPDLAVRVKRPVLFSATTPIEVEIHGDDLTALKDMAVNVQEVMNSLPELADVEASLKAGAPEIQVIYDRNRIMRYGLNLTGVARQVRDMVKGFEATKFNLKDRRIPILVRLQEDNRERLEDIRRLTINPGGEHPIPLNAIAELTIGEGPSEVRRIDGKRVALVNANLDGGSLGTAVSAIETALQEQIDWPEGMTFFITGQNKEWNDSQESLYLALFLSLFLVYVIMASQFESLIHPFIIMFTIPLAFFGTVLGLKLMGINLSIVVFLGMIMLAGIVVNNAIVLVDYINVLKRRGMETREAIVKAGQIRLRPILMTTATTMLGLLPMAMGFGDGAEIRTPMAIAVIFGLFTSTFLTLLVIPTIYHLLDLLAQKVFHHNLEEQEESTDQEAPA